MAKRKTTLKAKRAQSNTAKKAVVTCGLVLCLGSAELYAKPQFLLGVYPSVSYPLSLTGSPLGEYGAKDKLPFGAGGAARFTVRPVPVLDLFAEGSYEVLMYPYHPGGVESKVERRNFELISGTLGAGYNIPFSDRLSLNASMKAGVGVIEKKPQVKVGASVGVSFRARPALSVNADADVSYNGPQIIPVAFRPGLTVNLNELFSNQTNIDVQMIDQQPVFPVLYSWYEMNPFGTVRIANLEEGKISDIKVSFYQPQYMAQPNLCGEMDFLEREEYFDCDLTAFFNERMLELTELTDTKAIISVEYTFLGQKRTKEYQVTIPVYDRNSMNWADDRRAASFVSSKDPAAMWFAKYVTSVIRDNLRAGVPENVQYAMGIFETLDQFGINYVIDPNSAYADNTGGESADFLQFPYQTLMYRGGDCDDLSILVCSLFEAVGIKTAFITVPGHIYMAFDTGLSEEQAKEQFSDMSQLICRNDKVWMPLEVTISDEGFSKAWRVGAREWNVAAAQDAAVILPMEESWLEYKPVSVPAAEAKFEMPDRKIVSRLFEHRVEEWVRKEIEPAVIAYKNILSQKYDKVVSNNLGVLYSRYALFTEAEDEFKKLRKEGYLPAVINTANVYFAKQSYNRALASYKAVLREDPENDLAVLGIARSQWELGNFRECDKYYDQLKKQNPKLAAEYTYLASFVETKGRAYNLAGRLDTMSWSVQKTDALLPKEKELIEDSKLDFEPEPEFELPPLDLNDENRFEMDSVPEAKKRETEEELLTEIAEEEKAEIAAAEEIVTSAEEESEPETVEPAFVLPDFLFADIKNLAPDAEIAQTESSVSAEASAEAAVPSETDAAAPVETDVTVQKETEVALLKETDSDTAVPAGNDSFVPSETDFNSVVPSETDAAVPAETESEPEVKPLFQDSWMKIPAVAEEKKEEPVVDRAVPRFTESPSAEWAPETAFTVTSIPGMRSFDEEMGNTQNEKAFLFAEDESDSDDIENFDVFADTDTNTVLVKEEKIEAVNPFGSFFEDSSESEKPAEPSDLTSESIRAVAEKKAEILKDAGFDADFDANFTEQKKAESAIEGEAEEKAELDVVPEEMAAAQDKVVSAESAAAAQDKAESEESVAAVQTKVVLTETEQNEPEQEKSKKSGAKPGSFVVLAAAIISALSAVFIRRRKESPLDGKEGK